MRRLYARYPHGLPGVGLLVLRALVATSLWPIAPAIVALLGDRLSFGIGSALFVTVIAGFFAPWTATLCIVWQGIAVMGLGGDPMRLTLAGAAASLALALTGPGAYSYDSVFRGPSLVKIRPRR